MADFIAAGMTQFGSGWCWLSVKDGKLEVSKTPNGENPLVHGATPILGCDVWEHSYYIDYRNARPAYLEAFVDNLINWDYVAQLHEANPMLGHRGCRLSITYPEILEMQVRAIVEAAIACKQKRVDAHPEIMIPLVGTATELAKLRALAAATIGCRASADTK